MFVPGNAPRLREVSRSGRRVALRAQGASVAVRRSTVAEPEVGASVPAPRSNIRGAVVAVQRRSVGPVPLNRA